MDILLAKVLGPAELNSNNIDRIGYLPIQRLFEMTEHLKIIKIETPNIHKQPELESFGLWDEGIFTNRKTTPLVSSLKLLLLMLLLLMMNRFKVSAYISTLILTIAFLKSKSNTSFLKRDRIPISFPAYWWLIFSLLDSLHDTVSYFRDCIMVRSNHIK